MAGRFVLTMIATGGRQAGQSVSGYINLRLAPASAPAPGSGSRTAIIGTTDVAVQVVGAQRLGDLWSQDSLAPGVAVYEQRPATGQPTVIARMGSETTRVPQPGSAVAIEGAYTVLYVRRISAGGFAGGWASSNGMPQSEVSGHFCATRVE